MLDKDRSGGLDSYEFCAAMKNLVNPPFQPCVCVERERELGEGTGEEEEEEEERKRKRSEREGATKSETKSSAPP